MKVKHILADKSPAYPWNDFMCRSCVALRMITAFCSHRCAIHQPSLPAGATVWQNCNMLPHGPIVD